MLVLHRDGELSAKSLAAVTAHLGGCESCREEYDRICAARDWVRNQAAGGNVPVSAQRLSELRVRLLDLIAERTLADRRGQPLRDTVVAEIAPFLGARAASRLLRSVSENGQDLLSVIEPVLANFLGDRAAAELVSHLVDTAMGSA